MESYFRVITKYDVRVAQSILDHLAELGGGICLILPDVEKGTIFEKIPESVTAVDLRYGSRLTLLKGNHPRKEGIWSQYSHLDTGLAKNVVISDTITNSTPIENWKSEPHSLQSAPGGALPSEDYRHQHNHYQNFLSEVFNFSNSLNGVAIWGDSGAFAPGAKSWGGFLSARSWPVRWQPYKPEGIPEYTDEQFDAALIGLEIDVLNAGLDWGKKSDLLPGPMAKVGLQIVGFGSRNTAAIELRNEDTDDSTRTSETRRGAWTWGMIVRDALHEHATLIELDNGVVRRGIDLSKTTFKEGAVTLPAAGPKSGVVFGQDTQIYADPDETLVIEGIQKGVRLQFASGEFFTISESGDVSMSEKVKTSFRTALGL
ncbi:hypothetical protein BJF93_15175 [Xaviernesmea oryzae]|uniref:Uncharacterized protein n=1 Tax=Xaviernesmea oryzae TaxID=464029 RepID=A0A1Q9AXW7_9HYPH|nr:hypothetical protein [Xaviernesmea oryzae]OLP60298.1 hypothetical protein BJF93_15175 [Xaviernesmea oryzae]SEK24335.1 hypothetical protein SAMN04487976_101185 [Xaviernesmea oryzae]